MDFISTHFEANRLHLVRQPPASHATLRTSTTTEACRGFPRLAVPSLHTYNPRPPQTCWYTPLAVLILAAEAITQANILIDRNCHPRLTDYGLPLQFDLVEGGFHPYDDLQYLAPELLDPSFFGLENRTPTKESDIFAFGTVAYQVGRCFFFSANRDETWNLGVHGATTLPRSQMLDHRKHCYRGTTTPPPRFQ